MGTVGVLAVVALDLFLVASVGHAAAEDERCRSAILSRGTALFASKLDVLRSCLNGQLTSYDPNASCPSARDSERMDTADARSTAAMAARCAVPSPQYDPCVRAAAAESFDVASGLFRTTSLPEPDRTRRGCRATIGREAMRFAKLKARRLAGCNARVLGGTPGSGPSGPACDGPDATQAAIAAEQARAEGKIGRACGGPDRVVGTADDLDPQDLGFGSSCAGQPYCAFAIDTLPDLVACTSCIAASEVDEVSRGLAALPLDTTTACALVMGDAAADLVDDALTDLSDCEERVLRGLDPPPCPDQRTQDRLAADAAAYDARILSACGAVGSMPAYILQDVADFLIQPVYLAGTEEPASGLRNCKLAIGEFTDSSSSYARRKLSALASCRLKGRCGQTSGPCPDAEASASIASAASRVADTIHARCDAYTPGELGFSAGATCPIPGCGTAPITTIDEVITCLTCVADGVVEFVADIPM